MSDVSSFQPTLKSYQREGATATKLGTNYDCLSFTAVSDIKIFTSVLNVNIC